MSTDSGTEASCQRRDKGPVVAALVRSATPLLTGLRRYRIRTARSSKEVLPNRSRYRPDRGCRDKREYGLFINGELTESASGQTRDLKEPATDEPLATVAVASEQDVDRAVEAARSALDGPWGKTPPNERSRLLHASRTRPSPTARSRLSSMGPNVGKAISSVKAELAQAVENFRFYGSAIGSIAGRLNPIGGSPFYSLKEPAGVAGQIVPWNYPPMTTTWKLAPALSPPAARSSSSPTPRPR